MSTGAVLVGMAGIFFYQYFQGVIAAGLSSASGSSTSTAAALSIYNGTANMPIFITLAIFGVTFLIMGAVFIAGGHINENLTAPKLLTSPLLLQAQKLSFKGHRGHAQSVVLWSTKTPPIVPIAGIN